jgi:putative tricarboxylic transport membrane protein
MLDVLLQGLAAALQWPAIGYLLLGIMLGLYFGAVPGLSGLSGMAILLPFTFGMDPVSALSFLIGMYAVTTTSDSITAILIGVPGTAAAQATVLDGYPMAKNGEAARAFGAAFTCSAVGGVLGALVMGLSIPLVQPVVLAFAKPEFFMLGLLGLTMVGSLSGRSIVTGLAAAALGLMISMIGYAESVAIPRYWMGATYLLDGMPLVPFVLGVFALPELVGLAVRERPISDIPREQVAGGLVTGMMDSCRHWWLVLRSAVIGIYIGLLPGLGSTIADWAAYGHAVQSAKDKSRFGRGDVRGVIAPEAANNSVKGGELVPTVAFGIPGSAPMAILLGAFLIQGITPGPEMLTSKLHITFSMVWALVIANVVAGVLLMMWANQLQKIIFIPAHLVVPAVALFMFMGAWTASSNIGDWIALLVFGVVGVAMKAAGWPRPPLILGYILGRIMENALQLSMRSYGWDWLNRPIVLALAAVIALTVFLSIRSHLRQRRDPAAPVASDADNGDPRLSAGFAAFVLVVFAAAIAVAWPWPPTVRLFPMVIGAAGLVFAAATMLRELRAVRGRQWGGAAINRHEALRTANFFAWLAGAVAVTVLAGQHVALPLFIAAYLMVWGGYGWRLSLLYAAAALAFIVGMFDLVMHTTWYPALLFR